VASGVAGAQASASRAAWRAKRWARAWRSLRAGAISGAEARFGALCCFGGDELSGIKFMPINVVNVRPKREARTSNQNYPISIAC
jgi:hypothetical protein